MVDENQCRQAMNQLLALPSCRVIPPVKLWQSQFIRLMADRCRYLKDCYAVAEEHLIAEEAQTREDAMKKRAQLFSMFLDESAALCDPNMRTDWASFNKAWTVRV